MTSRQALIIRQAVAPVVNGVSSPLTAAIVGSGGIERILPLPLSDDEVAGLRRSATVLRDTIERIGAGEASA